VIVVIQAIGNAPQKLSAYLRTYTGNVHAQVVSVDEDDETADALRAIKDKIDVR
jgi:translation initiation factor eIF-2B subunit gamma